MPDGYMLNAEGVVQIKTVEDSITKRASVEEDDYNEWGLSKIAITIYTPFKINSSIDQY